MLPSKTGVEFSTIKILIC